MVAECLSLLLMTTATGLVSHVFHVRLDVAELGNKGNARVVRGRTCASLGGRLALPADEGHHAAARKDGNDGHDKKCQSDTEPPGPPGVTDRHEGGSAVSTRIPNRDRHGRTNRIIPRPTPGANG